MMYEKMPIGDPIFFEGQYKDDSIYDLYIQTITCSGFKVKKNHIPTIQLKSSRFHIGNEYIEETKPDEDGVALCLTNIDLKLFLEHYDVYDLNYESGWKFRSINGLFTNYIDKWIQKKNEGTLTGNKGQRAMAKMMLNSLYGKFATSLEVQSKIPYIAEDEILHYTLSEVEEKEGIYIPIRLLYYSLCKSKNNQNKSSNKRLFNRKIW